MKPNTPLVFHETGTTSVRFNPVSITPGGGTTQYYEAGSWIISGGSNSLRLALSAAVAKGEEEEGWDVGHSSATFLIPHSASIYSIDVTKDYIVTGGQDQSVCLFSIHKKVLLKTLLRCTLAIRHVAFRPLVGEERSPWVAVVSEECDIRLVNTNDTTKVITLTGHTRAISSCAFDPSGQLLISIGVDGVVRMWDIDTPENHRVLNVVAQKDTSSASSSSYKCHQVAWHPSGKFFAIPGPSKEILVVKRGGSGEVLFKIKSSTLSGNVSLLRWSPNGVYLLSICDDRQAVLWRPEHSRFVPVLTEIFPSTITSIDWHPTQNEVVLGDALGRVSYWSSVVDPGLPHPTQSVGPATQPALATLFEEAAPSAALVASKAELPKKSFDKAKSSTATMIDAEAEEGAESDSGSADMDDFIDDDDGAGYAEDLDNPEQLRKYQERSKKKALSDLQETASSLLRSAGSDTVDAPIAYRRHDPSYRGGMDGQEAFQPGSTPLKNDRRYLAFNMIGVVFSVDSASHSTISVEYHDRSKRPFHFPDHSNFTMACLSENGVVFASESWSGSNSAIYYKPFDSWASNSEWTMHLGQGENVKGLALSAKGIIAVTDAGFIRVISFSGVQTHIRCIPGEPVVCAANGQSFMVIYSKGSVYHGNQCMEYKLFDADMHVLHTESLPLTPGSLLSWIGISETGIPCIYDSFGIVRMLFAHIDYSWVPVLDTKMLATASSSKTEDSASSARDVFHWAVDVTDTHFMCVLCKGYDKFPFFPRPLITEVPLQCPLLELNGPAGVLEERLFRSSLIHGHAIRSSEQVAESSKVNAITLRKQESELDKTKLMLIQAACKAEKVQRALDLTAALSSLKSIDGAIKLAVHFHLPALAERMNIVKEHKYKQAQELERIALADQRALNYGTYTEDYRPSSLTDQQVNAGTANHSHYPPAADASPTSTIRSSDQLFSLSVRDKSSERVAPPPPAASAVSSTDVSKGSTLTYQAEKSPVIPRNPFAMVTKDSSVSVEPTVKHFVESKDAKKRKMNGNLKSMFSAKGAAENKNTKPMEEVDLEKENDEAMEV